MDSLGFHVLQTRSLPPAVSEEYSDIIVQKMNTPIPYLEEPGRFYIQPAGYQYSIIYANLSEGFDTVQAVGYSGMPKLYTFLSTTSLEASGILTVQSQPYLNLRGRNVLVGFLDSGIDYTHSAFRNPDGTTRILSLWDQTIQDGPPPAGLSYGTEYTADQINEALFSPDPGQIVPMTDPYGHGTSVAGIACGSPDPDSDFTGAAPESSILFVRLKPAKQYLRDYYLIPEGAAAYQENDLMLGVRYLMDVARQRSMPLVICISLGTNQGGHIGNSPLERILAAAQLTSGVYCVTGTGNEAGKAHHYFARTSSEYGVTNAELLIDQEARGFTLEFWADAPELYSMGFTSPLGETIQPVSSGTTVYREFRFALEPTVITVYSSAAELLSGSQLIMVRFVNPTVGIWRLQIVNRIFINGDFHMWLPISGLAPPETRFYTPDPDTTLVIPSCAEEVLSVGSYNAYNDSISIDSGRGYTRDGIIKPDFAAPGVSLTAPVPGGAYSMFTGSSAAASLSAGAVALLAEWGLRYYSNRYLSPREMRNLFIRGSGRNSSYFYPNRQWGYGTLDLYNIFQLLGPS